MSPVDASEQRHRLHRLQRRRLDHQARVIGGLRAFDDPSGFKQQLMTREIDFAGAIEFLSSTLGERFFNATVQWEEVSAEQVRFTVTRCLFPGLCAAAGAPEVAPLLCAGDAVFFGQTLKTVVLERPTTLAEGGPGCPFTLRASGRGAGAER